VGVLHLATALGPIRDENVVQVRVNDGREFLVASSTVMVIRKMNMLERPHGKRQKKGQARLQSHKTTKHQEIMPYARASFNQES